MKKIALGGCAVAFFIAFLWLSPWWAEQQPVGTTSEEPGADLIRAFSELFQHPQLGTRLEAYFLSVGLPERKEHTKILRERLIEADPLERIVILYALAAMTRNPQDIDAFLNAFPHEPQLFFDLMEGEYLLSGTFNTGIADFLLLLAYEPRTREKALPLLARFVCNTPGGLGTETKYYEDPLSGAYLAEHCREMVLDYALWDPHAHSFEGWNEQICAKTIAFLMQHGDPISKVTAYLMASRMRMPDDVMKIRRHLREFPGDLGLPEDSVHRYLLLSLHDDSDRRLFSDLLSSSPELIARILHAEKALYRPPLTGIINSLHFQFQLDTNVRRLLGVPGAEGQWAHGEFDEKNRARLLVILDTVLQYGNDWLDPRDRERLMPYMEENTISYWV